VLVLVAKAFGRLQPKIRYIQSLVGFFWLIFIFFACFGRVRTTCAFNMQNAENYCHGNVLCIHVVCVCVCIYIYIYIYIHIYVYILYVIYVYTYICVYEYI
jgi:hypothetical protein